MHTVDVSLDVPIKEKCRWLKAILGLSDAEMAVTLNISPKTLSNWLKDPHDTSAKESLRFHRLLKLVSLAKGVVRPDRLANWMHEPNKALEEMVPAVHLGDERGYTLVAGVLEEARSGVTD